MEGTATNTSTNDEGAEGTGTATTTATAPAPAMKGGSNNANTTDIYSKLVTIERKNVFFDVRQNPKGVYLKITESTPQTRRTVLLPGLTYKLLRDILRGAVAGEYELESSAKTEQDLEGFGVILVSKSTEARNKKFFLDLKQTKRGRAIKVLEKGARQRKSSIFLPESGWLQVKRCFEEIDAQAPTLLASGIESEMNSTIITTQQGSTTTQHYAPPGSTPYVGGGAGPPSSSSSSAPSSTTTGSRAQEEEVEHQQHQQQQQQQQHHQQPPVAPASNNTFRQGEGRNNQQQIIPTIEDQEIGENAGTKHLQNEPGGAGALHRTTISSKMIRLPGRKYFLDLQKNDRGYYLKIAQVAFGQREVIVVPCEMWPYLTQMLDAIQDKDYDRQIEGLELTTTSTATENKDNANSGRSNGVTLSGRSCIVGGKKYYVDVRQNPKGLSLKISELKSHHQGRTNCQILESCFPGVKQILLEYIQKTTTAQ